MLWIWIVVVVFVYLLLGSFFVGFTDEQSRIKYPNMPTNKDTSVIGVLLWPLGLVSLLGRQMARSFCSTPTKRNNPN